MPRFRFAWPFFALVLRPQSLPDVGRYREGLRDSFRRGCGDGVTVEVSGLIWPLGAEDGVDAVDEAGCDGAERLVVMAAAFGHQAAVEVSVVRVVLAGDVGGDAYAPSARGWGLPC